MIMRITATEEIIPLTPQTMQLLVALAERPMYGYGLLEQCKVDSAGLVVPNKGTLYTMLRQLLAMGLIDETQQMAGSGSVHMRRYYRLTSVGRQILDWEAARLDRLVEIARQR